MRPSVFLVALFLVTSTLGASSAHAEDTPRIKLLVLDVKSDDNRIRDSELQTISGLIAAHLSGMDRLEVISSADVTSIMELEGDKQAMGCEVDTSCLSEVADAMGARLVVIGQLGKLGNTYILNLSLFDSANTRTQARQAVKASGGLDELATAMEPGLDNLISEFFGEKVTSVDPVTSVGGGGTVGGGTPGAGFDLRVGLAAGAGGLGASVGFLVGAIVAVLQLGDKGIETWPGGADNTLSTAFRSAIFPGMFAYLGGALGAANFTTIIGANIAGASAGLAGFLTVLTCWAIGAVIPPLRVPMNIGAAVGGTLVSGGVAAALTVVFIVPQEEAVGGLVFGG